MIRALLLTSIYLHASRRARMKAKSSKAARIIGEKRHSHKQSVCSVAKSACRKFCRRAGVKRISESIYPKLRLALNKYVENVICKAESCSGKRKTIKASDVSMALRIMGQTVYH
jgi:histone H3/H4